MSNLDEPVPAKGHMAITLNTATLRDDDGGPPEDDHEALVKTLASVLEKVKEDIHVLPYPGGEWIPERHPVSTPNGKVTITLS